MSKVEAFFKEGSRKAEAVEYVASPRFKDENGKPIPWKLKQVPSRQMEGIKDRTGFYSDTDKMMGRFAIETTVATVVFPNLRDEQLQNNYGVKKPEDLLYEMLNSAEIDMLKAQALFVNGYGEDLDTLAGEAKNS